MEFVYGRLPLYRSKFRDTWFVSASVMRLGGPGGGAVVGVVVESGLLVPHLVTGAPGPSVPPDLPASTP